jgi:tetratricopeptide (TPR) repeat protein
VKRQQLLLISGGLVVLILLFFFGKTTAPKKETPVMPMAQEASRSKTVSFNDILGSARQRLSKEQNDRLIALENAVTRGDVKDQKLHIYHQLANFWKDSAQVFEPYAYYSGEAAKLENSEKSLNFAARLFIDNLLAASDPSMQNWLAINGKDLYDRSLAINPNNDSAKIGIGACYMFGNISDNPMQGILTVREIVQKNPENIYGHWILGLGGKKSGQFDKAIDHFNKVVAKQPTNVDVVFQLAETNELKGNNAEAVKWYEAAKKLIDNPNIKAEIDKRIQNLK